MENIPKYLYRGIKLNYELLKDFNGKDDLKPHYEPLIDEYGRKTVSDGNEYGVYMTDNILMAKQAYGNVNVTSGTIIHKNLDIRVSTMPIPLRIPAVGIIYKINTIGLNVHKPWISSQLSGHYNNGFQGNEWICDVIPSKNYEIIEITIGKDWLHDTKTIDVSNIEDAIRLTKEIVQLRKKQLDLLSVELFKLPSSKRVNLNKNDVELYKDLFSDDGVVYINPDDISLNTGLDYIKYLLGVIYNSNTKELDYVSLLYIESLKNRINISDTVDRVIELINYDIMLNLNRKENFINSSIQNGEIANTLGFDRKHDVYNEILGILLKKVNVVTNSGIKK